MNNEHTKQITNQYSVGLHLVWVLIGHCGPLGHLVGEIEETFGKTPKKQLKESYAGKPSEIRFQMALRFRMVQETRFFVSQCDGLPPLVACPTLKMLSGDGLAPNFSMGILTSKRKASSPHGHAKLRFILHGRCFLRVDFSTPLTIAKSAGFDVRLVTIDG